MKISAQMPGYRRICVDIEGHPNYRCAGMKTKSDGRNDMKKKMILNTATSLLAQLVAVIYGFVLPRLILEQFGSEVNGLTQSIKQFLGIINFLDLGVGQVMRSALYRPLEERNVEKISSVLASGGKFYRRLAMMLAGYVAILVCVYPYLVDGDFGWVFTATLIAAMAISSFAQYYFGIINEQLIHADQRGYVIFTLQIVCNVLNALVCVWLMKAGGSIHAVKLVTSLIFLIRPLVIYLYIQRKYRIDRKIKYSGEPISQKWNGIAQHISAVVLDGTDTIVLTLFSTLSNVSVYSVYYLVIASLQQLYQSATAGVQSAAGALWAKQDRQAQEKMFAATEMGLHFVTVFLFSCVGLLIVPFVRVYTNGLTDTNYIQPLFAGLLALAYGIRCLRTPYNIWILAAGHYKQTQRCHVTAAALNLIISVIAVLRWGLVGVAVGTLIAMVYQTTWMAIYNTKHLLKRPLWSVIKQFGVDILTAGTICLLAAPITLGQVSYLGWFVMAVKVGLIALTVTVLAAVIFCRKTVMQLLKRRGR